jgi:hypothetical protein
MGRPRRTARRHAAGAGAAAALHRQCGPNQGLARIAPGRHDPPLRGVEISAADWVSQNRYVRIFFHERTRLQEAFVEHFLAQYPSTLR